MSTGQIAGTVVGAAIGFVTAGPGGAAYGAFQGATVGYAVGGMLDPPKGPSTEGPRLSDTSVQTSTYGAFIPRIYGTVAIDGNIFWLENNKIKETVKKKSSGGKGGGSSVTNKTYSYSATLAIGICEGPISYVRRVWAGPDLIYDAGASDAQSVAQSVRNIGKFTFYAGDNTQLPDSRIQADLGSANVPAYRGLAYAVIRDFDLTKYGNAIPNFRFEVVQVGARQPVQLLGTSTIPGDNTGGYGAAMYTTIDGRMQIYRRTAGGGSDIEVYQSMLDGSVTTENALTANGSSIAFPVGQSDTDIFVLSDNNSLYTYSRAGILQSQWDFPNSEMFAQWAYYRRGNYEYLQMLGGYWGDSCILRRKIGELSYAPVIIVPTSDPDGTISNYFPGDAVHFVLTGNKVLRCYDSEGASVLWSVDMSAESNLSGTFLYSSVRSEIDDACYIRSGVYFWRVTEGGYVSLGTDAGFAPSSPYEMYDNLIGGVWASFSQPESKAWHLKLDRFSSDQVPLSDIVSAECNRTGLLSPSDYDVTQLDDSVTGYRVSKIGGIRQAIEPLQGAFLFDVIQSGYQIKFISRGGSSVASPVIGDLGVDQQLKQSREMDSQMPVKITANYLDAGRNYDTNTQTWERLNTDSVNTRSLDLPIVLTATQAAQIVERLGGIYWLERVDFGPFTLPPTYAHLEPTDIITLDVGYAVYEMRLTSVNYKSDGSLECMARPNNAAVYVSNATADDVDQSGSVEMKGGSAYQMLDIPPVNSELQNSPGMIGVMAGYYQAWSGGTIYRSQDASQTWEDLQSFAAPCTYGFARDTLPANTGTLINYGDTLRVDLVAGELDSVTEAQMLNGANVCAYGKNGRMEVLRFMTATLEMDGSYTISGLWRGDFGSEWATGLHEVGDVFVLLNDSDAATITMAQGQIGVPIDYRGITSGDDIDADSSRTIVYAGANLECLSPCHASATGKTLGDVTITWHRRSRINGWRDYVDAPLGEASESYEVEILLSGTVVRTLTSSVESVVYTAADQATDIGSYPPFIDVRIYQISALVGRGNPLVVTV